MRGERKGMSRTSKRKGKRLSVLLFFKIWVDYGGGERDVHRRGETNIIESGTSIEANARECGAAESVRSKKEGPANSETDENWGRKRFPRRQRRGRKGLPTIGRGETVGVKFWSIMAAKGKDTREN